MGRGWATGIAAVASACFSPDLARVPDEARRFEPESGGAPEGWLVREVPLDLQCPDGATASLVAVSPAEPEGPLPVALIYPPGAFDHVRQPRAEHPLDGPTFAEPSRLGRPFGIRQAFATLGMFGQVVEGSTLTGRLAAALAREGVAVVVPANCWGDLWASRSGGAENDFAADFFRREALALAEWARRASVDPEFAAEIGAELPFAGLPDAVFAVGLGEGSRAVGEILGIDRDEDGASDFPLAGVLLDSPLDDLGTWLADPVRYTGEVEGLARLFPPGGRGDLDRGSLAAVPDLPPRVGYVYSTADPALPSEVHAAALARLAGAAGVRIRSVDVPAHVLLDGTLDEAETEAAVSHLLGR